MKRLLSLILICLPLLCVAQEKIFTLVNYGGEVRIFRDGKRIRTTRQQSLLGSDVFTMAKDGFVTIQEVNEPNVYSMAGPSGEQTISEFVKGEKRKAIKEYNSQIFKGAKEIASENRGGLCLGIPAVSTMSTSTDNHVQQNSKSIAAHIGKFIKNREVTSNPKLSLDTKILDTGSMTFEISNNSDKDLYVGVFQYDKGSKNIQLCYEVYDGNTPILLYLPSGTHFEIKSLQYPIGNNFIYSCFGTEEQFDYKTVSKEITVSADQQTLPIFWGNTVNVK